MVFTFIAAGDDTKHLMENSSGPLKYSTVQFTPLANIQLCLVLGGGACLPSVALVA
jgi:hypothetical protein